jgi:hypothetical protein
MCRCVSSSTPSSSITRPEVRLPSNPAITLTVVLLPQPDGRTARPRRASAARSRVERKGIQLLADGDAEHQRPSMRRTRRANHSRQQQTAQAQHHRQDREPRRATRRRRLQGGIKSQRQGARFAGNIRHEGDDGAEFSQRRRKCRDRAGQHPRQHQRQRDRGEPIERAGAQGARGILEPAVDVFQEMRMARTISGKDMTAVASAAPLRLKMSSMPKTLSSHATDGPRVPNSSSSI